MAGRGPAPKERRRRTTTPTRGDWQSSPDFGWQHGAIPDPPDGLLPASVIAWETWMQSWVAAHWTPADLPGLRLTVSMFDQIERGQFRDAGELRMWLDGYGITPKGQQDRRWVRPQQAKEQGTTAERPTARYRHLQVVSVGPV